MLTIRDMRGHVDTALDAGHGADDFTNEAREAIVAELHDRYGLVDLDTVDHDEFWAIVAKHDPGAR